MRYSQSTNDLECILGLVKGSQLNFGFGLDKNSGLKIGKNVQDVWSYRPAW